MTNDPRQGVLLDEPICWYGTPFVACVRAGGCRHCRAYTARLLKGDARD